ncbi:MAG: type IV pilus modification protein PilV [Casimicrobiaceae bacterium]
MRSFERMCVRGEEEGFSLLEVLVTLVIVAIGLLGVAGLQVSAIKLNFVAETRSKGVIYAADILERIRANPLNAPAYATDFDDEATSDATQAERDLRDWKQALAQLPNGEGKIVVTATDASLCELPAISRCSDVEVTIRWTESNVVGGSSSKQEFKTKTRV